MPVEIRKDKTLVYACGDVLIAPMPTEIVLAEGFIRFEREGLLDQIFHEGVPSLSWFLQEFVARQQAILACFNVESTDKYSLIGFTWLCKSLMIGNTKLRKTESGHAYFRKVKPDHVLIASALSMEWIFDLLPDLAVVYGTTPEKNRAAVRFLKKIGLEQTSNVIPAWTCYPDKDGNHVLCGAILSTMTRERWQAERTRFFS